MMIYESLNNSIRQKMYLFFKPEGIAVKTMSPAKRCVSNRYGLALLVILASAATASQEKLSVQVSDDISLNSALEVTPGQQAEYLLKEEITKLSKQLVNDFPNDLKLTKLAFQFHSRCQNDRYAMLLLENALKAHPANYDLLYATVSELFNRGHYEQVITYAKQALAIKPQDNVIRVNYAIALSNLGRHAESIKELEQMIEASGGSVLAYQYLGQGYMQQKEYEKAKACFEEIVRGDASHLQAHYALAQIYMKLQQKDRAREHMEIHRDKAIKERLKTKQSRTHELHQNDNPLDQSETIVLDSSEDNLRFFSRSLADLCIRGYTLSLATQDTQAAHATLRRSQTILNDAITIAPDCDALYRAAAFIYGATQNNLNEAEALAEKAVELRATAENYYILGQVCNRNSNRTEALSALEKAVELAPDNPAYKRFHNKVLRGIK